MTTVYPIYAECLADCRDYQPTSDVDQLRRRRVELNRLIKHNTAAMNSVPTLAPGKSWAADWRKGRQRPYRSRISFARRELAAIAKLIGPPPAFFKPRPLPTYKAIRDAVKRGVIGLGAVTDQQAAAYRAYDARWMKGRERWSYDLPADHLRAKLAAMHAARIAA